MQHAFCVYIQHDKKCAGFCTINSDGYTRKRTLFPTAELAVFIQCSSAAAEKNPETEGEEKTCRDTFDRRSFHFFNIFEGKMFTKTISVHTNKINRK